MIAAFKVYPDGREELIRNVELSDLSATSFKDIVAAGSSQTVTTMPFEGGGGSPMAFFVMTSSGRPDDSAPLVSLATPSLPFEELTLKKPSGEVPKPPFAPRPS